METTAWKGENFRFLDFLENKSYNILVVWNSSILKCETIFLKF